MNGLAHGCNSRQLACEAAHLGGEVCQATTAERQRGVSLGGGMSRPPQEQREECGGEAGGERLLMLVGGTKGSVKHLRLE